MRVTENIWSRAEASEKASELRDWLDVVTEARSNYDTMSDHTRSEILQGLEQAESALRYALAELGHSEVAE